jgi:hypothetical protein
MDAMNALFVLNPDTACLVDQDRKHANMIVTNDLIEV